MLRLVCGRGVCQEESERNVGMINLMTGWRIGGELKNWRSRQVESLKSGEIEKGQLEVEMEERKWMIYDCVLSLPTPTLPGLTRMSVD